jgi:hypothetical protein
MNNALSFIDASAPVRLVMASRKHGNTLDFVDWQFKLRNASRHTHDRAHALAETLWQCEQLTICIQYLRQPIACQRAVEC